MLPHRNALARSPRTTSKKRRFLEVFGGLLFWRSTLEVFVKKDSGTGCAVCARAVEKDLVKATKRQAGFIAFTCKWGSKESADASKNRHRQSAFHKDCKQALEATPNAAAAAAASDSHEDCEEALDAEPTAAAAPPAPAA
eukprot:Hpha_TRINITY_DN13422_c0_g1::TRINITY_DN13422_c0_g1_i1::g.131323::m.131323